MEGPQYKGDVVAFATVLKKSSNSVLDQFILKYRNIVSCSNLSVK